ncbi:hypothetical protein EIP86_000357 [Pleurotus ostreatoroseus]|nr:hypothetical protein EIP86_000357 [Pleurotus ostreatoroseus]
MAWYTDVMHEFRPVTSGYRLALSYNVIHTTTSLRPALSNTIQALDAIRRVLLAWRAGAGSSAPEKILCLLDHKYSNANLRGSVLKGSDAQRVAILDVLCKELGFRLGLASIEYHIKGTTSDYGERRYKRRDCYWDEDEDEESEQDEDSLSITRVIKSSMTLSNFVYLDSGDRVDGKLEMLGNTKTIPDNLKLSVMSGAHDEQQYEDHNTIVWRDFSTLDEVDNSDTASPEQRATIDYLLNRQAATYDDAVLIADAICHAACRWRDLDLWKRTVEKCSGAAGVVTLDVEDACIAIKTFGFDAVRPSLEVMLQQEKKNHKLFAFLDEFRAFNWEDFEEDFEDEDDEPDQDVNDGAQDITNGDEFVAVVSEWIEAQWSASLKALRRLTKEDFATLSQLARDNGGLAYVRDSILPQLVQNSHANSLREFAAYMTTEQGPVRDADPSLRVDVVSHILKASLFKLKLKIKHPPVSTNLYAQSSHAAPTELKPEPSLEVAKSYFKVFIAMKCLDGASDVVTKIADISGRSAIEAQIRANSLVIPFLTWIVETYVDSPDSNDLPELYVLQKSAITPMLDVMTALPSTVTRDEIRKLLRTVSLPGGVEVFAACILPKLDTLASSEASTKAIIEELQPLVSKMVLPASYQGPSLPETMTSLTKKYAQCVSIHSMQAIAAAIDCCLQVQSPETVWDIIKRVLDPEKLKERDALSNHYGDSDGVPRENLTYADTVVAPLMARLRKLADEHQMLDALAPAFRQIARTYVEQTLGPLPPGNPDRRLAEIRRWKCECAQCIEIRTFLLRPKPGRSITLLRIGAPKRKHVENFLRQYATGEGATWRMVGSNPQGIEVTKTELLYEQIVWKARQRKAIKLIKDASTDDAERNRIFGDEYAEYERWIKGIPLPGMIACLRNLVYNEEDTIIYYVCFHVFKEPLGPSLFETVCIGNALCHALCDNGWTGVSGQRRPYHRPLTPQAYIPVDLVSNSKHRMSEEAKEIDIASALEGALGEKLDFTGAISFHQTYPDAPNPGLQLSDIGPIGIPLSSREAQVIKTCAEQAPFGMGERTVVDTSVRDTWQMDADKVSTFENIKKAQRTKDHIQVSFCNPTWSVWLQRVVTEVCSSLGVNHAASQPRCELYKLLLYETGSQYVD